MPPCSPILAPFDKPRANGREGEQAKNNEITLIRDEPQFLINLSIYQFINYQQVLDSMSIFVYKRDESLNN